MLQNLLQVIFISFQQFSFLVYSKKSVFISPVHQDKHGRESYVIGSYFKLNEWTTNHICCDICSVCFDCQ